MFQGVAVAALARVHAPQMRGAYKLMGDLSYPVFLDHWLVGYVLTITLFPGQSRGILLMVATLVVATTVAYALCQLQDVAIEPLRGRVRALVAS